MDADLRPFLKRWRVATTSRPLQKALSPLRCNHERRYKHATIEGQETAKAAKYPRKQCEAALITLFRNAIMRPVPAMPTAPKRPEDPREKDVKEEELETMRPQKLII